MVFLVHELVVDLVRRLHLNRGEVVVVVLAHLPLACVFSSSSTNPASLFSRGRQEISSPVGPCE